MAGRDLYRVKCSERFIRRIKWCEHWVVLAALLALSYPPELKAFCNGMGARSAMEKLLLLWKEDNVWKWGCLEGRVGDMGVCMLNNCQKN